MCDVCCVQVRAMTYVRLVLDKIVTLKQSVAAKVRLQIKRFSSALFTDFESDLQTGGRLTVSSVSFCHVSNLFVFAYYNLPPIPPTRSRQTWR